MESPRNPNYCATVVAIKNLLPLDGCDNLLATTIFGNQVLVGKNTAIGDIGLYFPVETQLTPEYLGANNLYRHSELNTDKTVKGFFEDNGRVRCVKLRGHRSEGFFSQLNTLDFCGHHSISIGTDFDYVNGIEICRKYEVRHLHKLDSTPKLGKSPKKSKLVKNQFRFHVDTEQLGRNLHKFGPNDLISCTAKLHGASSIFSKVLCHKKLKWYEKLLKRCGIQVIETGYENIYSSRKVIKNDNDPIGDDSGGFYGDNVWAAANKIIEPLLVNGMTIYSELVGFTPTGKPIQKGYDYGCKPIEISLSDSTYFSRQCSKIPFDIYVYRITITNIDGIVFEFSSQQVQSWCKLNGIKPVELLYYGTASDLIVNYNTETVNNQEELCELETFESRFLEAVKSNFVGGNCKICVNKVPAEGVVVRREGLVFEAYKCKSPEFLAFETKQLDTGDVGEDT